MASYERVSESLNKVRSPVLALGLLVPVPTTGALMAMWVVPGPVGGAIYACAKAWILMLPVVWTLFIDQCTMQPCIMTHRQPVRHGLSAGFTLGLAISVVIIALFELINRSAGIDASRLRQVALDAGFGSLVNYCLFGVYLATINALLEEYVWRWFVFRAAASAMSESVAVPISAAFFTLHHVVVLAAYFPAWLTVMCSLGVFTGGCVWSWCYLRYRSVWPGYVSHIVVDLAILYIGWRLLFA